MSENLDVVLKKLKQQKVVHRAKSLTLKSKL